MQALTQAITFQAPGESPSALQRTVTFILNDGDGAVSNTATKLVTVVPVNDVPVLTGSGAIGYGLNDPAVLLAATYGVTDVDSFNVATGRLLVKFDSGGDAANRIFLGGAFSLLGNNVVLDGTTTIGTRNTNGGVGTSNFIITFNASATPAIVQSLIRDLRFRTVSGVGTQQRIVSLNLTDGDGGTSNTVTRTINVSP